MRRSKFREQDDWTDMSMSEWMNTTPSEWMDRMVAGWGSGYTDLMNMRPSEWMERMYGSGMGQATGYRQHHQRHHHQGCTCGKHDRPCPRCGSPSCECFCCIGDVDLVVSTHVGEQRVIQLVIENERHREKEISLELSDWTLRSGKEAPVQTVLLEPKKFTLAACAEQDVTLIIRVGGNSLSGRIDSAATNPDGEPDDKPRERIPDVDDCVVATADLRIVGCDHRPLRLAVAILPRDCDPYRVSCGCTCC